MPRIAVTAHSVRVLRESGLTGSPLDGIRSATFVKEYGPFAAVIESAARQGVGAVAITDGAGDVTLLEQGAVG
jgi:fatty-acyl-CoA synthase